MFNKLAARVFASSPSNSGGEKKCMIFASISTLMGSAHNTKQFHPAIIPPASKLETIIVHVSKR